MILAAPGVITEQPPGGMALQILCPVIWIAMALYFFRDCRQHHGLTRNALIFIAATSMSWMEWFGDWGSYVIYNPYFWQIPWEGLYPEAVSTPYKPLFVVFSYGWYYTLNIIAVFWLSDQLRARRPDLKPWQAVLVVGVPVTYLINLAFEGSASVLAMWSYATYVGPGIESSAGNYPLLYPVVIVVVWVILVALVTYTTDPRGLAPIDRLMGVRRWVTEHNGFVAPAPVRETAGLPGSTGTAVAKKAGSSQAQLTFQTQWVRLFAWIIGFNVSYAVIGVIFPIVVRAIHGLPSTLVP